jgi:hypothetical protein
MFRTVIMFITAVTETVFPTVGVCALISLFQTFSSNGKLSIATEVKTKYIILDTKLP